MQLQLLERLRDIVETTQNGKFYKITIKSNGNQIVLDNYDDVTLYLQALVNAYNLQKGSGNNANITRIQREFISTIRHYQ